MSGAVCQMTTRTTITLPDTVVSEIDALVGPRGRSAFLAVAARDHLKRERLRLALDESRGAMVGASGRRTADDILRFVADLRSDDRVLTRGAGRAGRSTMNYLLDTTVVLDFVHDRAGAVELVDRLFSEAETLFTCEVVTCEALSGGDERERRAIRALLTALEYVAIGPDGARWAASARRSGRAAHGARSLADALIAATTWNLGATLVTRNPSDFERQGIPVLRYG